MKNKILIFVHTEYHLILAVNQINMLYQDSTLYDVYLHINSSSEARRLTHGLSISRIPAKVAYVCNKISVDKDLDANQIEFINEYINFRPDIFIFFQENSLLMAVLTNEFAKMGAEIHLYQDGLKPYVDLKYHSIGLIKAIHMQNKWLKRNGFETLGYLAPLYSKKYAYFRSISKVYLTFPESYHNWSKKTIEKIELMDIESLRTALADIFNWKDELLAQNSEIIFYLNQPMHDDGVEEIRFLKALNKKFPEKQIFIKLHPSTFESKKIDNYVAIPNTTIIKSTIPAELFIMQLKHSIVLSIASTSMFINNTECKFYYLHHFFAESLYRLKRYRLSEPPVRHINAIHNMEEIVF